MSTQISTKFGLKYRDTNGFGAAQGGRGYHLPVDIAVRSDGRIYVLSRSALNSFRGCNIGITDLEHNWYDTLGGHGKAPGMMEWPTSIIFDKDDRLFLADESLQRITVFDSDHNYENHWGAHGSGDGEFDGPAGIAFDSDGNLLVVDEKNHRIQRYTPDGQFISSFGSEGSGDGEFNYPWGITVAPNGHIYVADWRNDRIQRFTHLGELIDVYGTRGRDEGQFDRPSDIAVDKAGNIFVTDWGNQRLQVFDSEWNFLTTERGAGEMSPWALEYITSNADEKAARDLFDPYPKLDVDDPHEVSARTEPYFWDPASVTLHGDNLILIVETGRHRFQIYEKT